MTHRVAVLGGGIAGAAAALRLARAGLRPIWIAAPRPDGFKPGEHLSAAAIPLLRALGSDAVLRSDAHRPAHGTYSAWGSDMLVERNAMVQLEGPPTVLDRAVFEDGLTDAAQDAGATRIWRDVAKVRIADGRWRFDTGNHDIDAGFVFDATGRKAIVASQHATRFQGDKLCCFYALLSGGEHRAPRPVTLIETEERGWWYLSLLADGRVVLNFYTDADLPCFEAADLLANARKTKAVSAYLADFGYSTCTTPRRITTNSSWIAPAVGAGWASIGDASAAFDPLSSHGMTTALWSALEATDAYISQDAQKMRAYAESVAKGVQDLLIAKRTVYCREMRWSESPFWARRHAATLAAQPRRSDQPLVQAGKH